MPNILDVLPCCRGTDGGYPRWDTQQPHSGKSQDSMDVPKWWPLRVHTVHYHHLTHMQIIYILHTSTVTDLTSCLGRGGMILNILVSWLYFGEKDAKTSTVWDTYYLTYVNPLRPNDAYVRQNIVTRNDGWRIYASWRLNARLHSKV